VTCSGTSFALVDLEAVWPLLPTYPEDAEEALHEWQEERALAFMDPAWGVFVLTMQPADNDGHLEVFLLLAVAFQHGAFEAAEPAVLAIARDLGAEQIAFRSVRRGWSRRLGLDWTPRGTREFTRPVT